MRAVNGTFDGKKVTLSESVQMPGPVEVVVVFPEPDPWDEIVRDPAPRPALSELADQALRDHAAGKTEPLDPENL